MKKKIIILLLFVLGSAGVAMGQGKTYWYYSEHTNELLKDATDLFRQGNYDYALQLCNWHYQLLGEGHEESGKRNELLEKIQTCKDLVNDIEFYQEWKDAEEVKRAEVALSRVNPDDPRVKHLKAASRRPARRRKSRLQRQRRSGRYRISSRLSIKLAANRRLDMTGYECRSPWAHASSTLTELCR